MNTEAIYKRKRNVKDYLFNISPSKKDVKDPLPLCVAINRLEVDTKTPFTFRINIYKRGFYINDSGKFTKQQEMEFLIAEFEFIKNTIKHNIQIASTKPNQALLENVKDLVERQVLLNTMKVSTRVVHLNGHCDLKNLLIAALDPNSTEKVNNIQMLTYVLDKIKNHELCTDEILNTLVPMYNKCVKLSTQTVDAIKNGSLSLDNLFHFAVTTYKQK